jgi:predicted metal-dependent peptidase
VRLFKECQGGRRRSIGIDQAIEAKLPPPYKDRTPTDMENPPDLPRQGQFDMHLNPGTGGSDGKEDDDQPRERSELEWQQAVAAGMAVAKAQGKLPSALELVFGEILEPTISWKDHIRALFARRVGSGGYDWRKPDRRLIVRDIVAPGRSGHGARLVVVGGDNSGSIYSDKTLLGRWLGEIGGILEDVNPEQIILIWCDAKVHEVDEITDPTELQHIQKRGSTGGGGTSFVPVFQWIEDNHLKPDVLVYLTDMMGTFPAEEPSYPVIWGSISSPEQHPAPFGDLVFIPTTK